MARTARGGTTGVTTGANGLPKAVSAATALWIGAVAAGAAEAAIHAWGLQNDGMSWSGLLPGLGLRALVYAVVLTVVALFHQGHRWARWALALGPGAVGTFSLVVESAGWLLGGGAADGIPALTGEFVSIAALRALHLLAVISGVVLMFRPSANAYFGGRPRPRY
ncbi:hypothetical protein [Nocardiopsis nanhaiensis]